MPILRPPANHHSPDKDVKPWLALAASQGDITPEAFEIGAVVALQDRNKFSEEWSDTSRRVYVHRYSESRVAIHDEHGALIDDTGNFTPGGIQPFSKDDGDDDFLTEWHEDLYYRIVPMSVLAVLVMSEDAARESLAAVPLASPDAPESVVTQQVPSLASVGAVADDDRTIRDHEQQEEQRRIEHAAHENLRQADFDAEEAEYMQREADNEATAAREAELKAEEQREIARKNREAKERQRREEECRARDEREEQQRIERDREERAKEERAKEDPAKEDQSIGEENTHEEKTHEERLLEDSTDDDDDDKPPRQILLERLVPGARLLCMHPQLNATVFERTTVYLRKSNGGAADSLIIVYDNDKLSPQHVKIELNDDLEVTPKMFIHDSDDIPLSERVVGVFMARCSKVAEGYFYGQYDQGANNSLLAPSKFVHVEASTTKPRFPTSFHPGVEVTFRDRSEKWVFLHFLIIQEPGQARFFAVVGNPAAEVASPSILHRFAVVPMKIGSEANFNVTSPLVECEPMILHRLTEAGRQFTRDITAAQLKRGEWGLPKVNTATTTYASPSPHAWLRGRHWLYSTLNYSLRPLRRNGT